MGQASTANRRLGYGIVVLFVWTVTVVFGYVGVIFSQQFSRDGSVNSDLFRELLKIEGAETGAPANSDAFEALRHEQVIQLPSEHESLLRQSNGAIAYGGYLRLFGIGTENAIDAIRWNVRDCWKFAWGERCNGYWSFAETGWGDQYAYRIDRLMPQGVSNVYFLDAFSMKPKIIASSFADFFINEFARSARDPFDEMTALARQKLGPLEQSFHVNFMPSLVIGGPEDIGNVRKMDARAAMICQW